MEMNPLSDAQIKKLLRDLQEYEAENQTHNAAAQPQVTEDEALSRQNRILFGAFIRALLQRRAMSPEILADELDTTQDYVDELLQGSLRMHQISEDTILRLGRIFNYEFRVLSAVLKYPLSRRPWDNEENP